MSDQVGNPEDKFSHNEVHVWMTLTLTQMRYSSFSFHKQTGFISNSELSRAHRKDFDTDPTVYFKTLRILFDRNKPDRLKNVHSWLMTLCH